MATSRGIKINDITDQVTYTNSTQVPESHGGVSSGETFNEATMSEMFDKILYPYIAPYVSLSVSPSNYLREYGTSIASIDLTASLTEGTNNITTLTFYKDGTSLTSISDPTSSKIYTDDGGITGDSSVTYQAEVTDGTQTNSSYKTYNFVYPYYHGTGAPGLTPSEIQNLTKLIESKSDKTVSESPSSEVYYFAYPSSYGSLSTILDENGFDITSDFTETVETFSANDGTNQDYYVYEFNNTTTQTDFEITYKY